MSSPSKSAVPEDHEVVLEPELPIVDTHHHLRDPIGGVRYLFPELLADLQSGHNIVATVAIEDRDMFRASGPSELRPVGETEFLNGIAAMFASGKYGTTKVCAGIVGYADLALGTRVVPVLEAHIAASGGRFRGIRVPAAWDDGYTPERWKKAPVRAAPHMLVESAFREGFSCLASLGLSFDAHIFHTQLPELVSLAHGSPNVTIIANHCAGLLGLGPYANRRVEVFDYWKARLQELSECPNVFLKLGGLRWADIPIDVGSGSAIEIPRSERFATAWRPYIETCIEAFGPDRCMFESNFPPEREASTYATLWNAFKRVTAGYSSAERTSMFSKTAATVYRLGDAICTEV